MIGVTMAAVLICLLQNLGIVGAMAALAMAVLFSIYATFRGSTPAMEMAFDLIWGVVLPVLCLTFDPILFQPDPGIAMTKAMPTPEHIEWTAFAVSSYLILGFQMVALFVWIGVGHLLRTAAGWMSGILWAGFAIALTIALAFPIGGVITLCYMFDNLDELVARIQFIGAKAMIAVLAITPFLTARVFFRRARQASFVARQYFDPEQAKRRTVIGMVLALVVPLGLLFCIQGRAALVELMPYLFSE